jgi:hypothetical protein
MRSRSATRRGMMWTGAGGEGERRARKSSTSSSRISCASASGAPRLRRAQLARRDRRDDAVRSSALPIIQFPVSFLSCLSSPNLSNTLTRAIGIFSSNATFTLQREERPQTQPLRAPFAQLSQRSPTRHRHSFPRHKTLRLQTWVFCYRAKRDGRKNRLAL